MKKLAIILLSIALVVASIALVACKVDQDTCEHQWGEWEDTTPATCTVDGVQTRTCSVCKKQETQAIEATGHKIVDSIGTRKSCTSVDLTAGAQCTVCEELLTGDTLLEALGHKNIVTMNAVAATCTEKGLTEGKQCRNCGLVFVAQEEVAALGHEVVDAPAIAETCTEPAYTAGTACSRCGEYFSGHEVAKPALGHDVDANEVNYFTYVLCGRCYHYVTKDGADPFETEFIYDFDDAKKQEIDEAYQAIKDALTAKTVSGETLDDLFEVYDGYVSYVQAQYQFARVLNDITYDNTTKAEYAAMSEYFNTTVSRYYTLFKEIYESDTYRDYFFQEWSQDDIDEVLALADSYDLENQNAVDKIIEEYEKLLNSWRGTTSQTNKLYDLYSQLVEANNNIAVKADYANYMDYAYDKIFERDYTPAQVAAMRGMVKETIGPLLAKVGAAYIEWNDNYKMQGGWKSTAAQNYYSQYAANAIWGNPNKYLNNADTLNLILNSRKSVADYYTFLSDGDSSVDFYGALQDVFKTGNVFLADNTNMSAYTWYIYQKKTPIMVFGAESSYRDAFTFIHEFGHYYQFVHNGRLSVPMDHDETQSQGNEMLFLAWLHANMPQGVDEGFEILELEQLVNMLGSIVMSTAVDEFEYIIYTGADEFDGEPLPLVKGSDVIDYGALYKSILESYWAGIGGLFNTNYWMYVTFDNAAYYISYAMSALPCIELYAKAGTGAAGLAAARDSYLKLFTFSSEDSFLAEDRYGDKYVTATYEQILNWAGLGGPFQQTLYETIETYFESRFA